jgi:hypothetical protein
MSAYDPDTGFRTGSFAQRNPGAYFAIFGVIYAIAWFALSMAGHHARTGKYTAAAVIVPLSSAHSPRAFTTLSGVGALPGVRGQAKQQPPSKGDGVPADRDPKLIRLEKDVGLATAHAEVIEAFEKYLDSMEPWTGSSEPSSPPAHRKKQPA